MFLKLFVYVNVFDLIYNIYLKEINLYILSWRRSTRKRLRIQVTFIPWDVCSLQINFLYRRPKTLNVKTCFYFIIFSLGGGERMDRVHIACALVLFCDVRFIFLIFGFYILSILFSALQCVCRIVDHLHPQFFLRSGYVLWQWRIWGIPS